MLALLGTWLPADVYGRNTGIGQAIRRGIRSFGSTLGRLAIPAVLYLIPFVVWLLVLQASPLGSTLTMEVAAYVLVANLIALLKVFALVIATVILARAYLRDLENVSPAGVPAGAASTCG